MKLPKNGKVIVIDNEPKEAEPLLKVLSKNKIPYIYYTGDTDSLPMQGDTFDDIRILFLDINLTHNAVEQAIIAQLNSTLRRIVKPGSPYIAAIWSNNQDAHTPLIEDLFSTRASDIAPISKLFLTKGDFFQYNIDGGGYILDPYRPDIIGDLEKRINDCLNQVDAVRLLIDWENSVSEALTETICSVSNIIDNDNFWNDNLKHIYYKLAHAQLGKTITNHNDQEIQQAALNTLTSSFNDRVEMKIANIAGDAQMDIKNTGKNYYKSINDTVLKLCWKNPKYYFYINNVEKGNNNQVEKLSANNNLNDQDFLDQLKSSYKLISPKLNAEILISKQPKVKFHPGNVYHKPVTGKRKRKLLKTYFPDIDRQQNGQYMHHDLTGFRFVEVECTPVCDYSQSKRLRFRFLPGILYLADIETKLVSLDSIYSEIPSFEFKGKIYKLVFDYRLFKAVNKDDDSRFSSYNFLFRLNSQLLTDLQARLSSHINRPGITTIS